MRIFICFASEQDELAERIYRKLLSLGYEPFYASESIRGGEGYDRRIQSEIQSADRVVFLASPEALEPDCFTHTELDMISARWPDPTGRVLPVLIGGTSASDLPPYLGSVTSAFNPAGSVPSAVVAEVAQLWPRRRLPAWIKPAAIATLVLVAILAAVLALRGDEYSAAELEAMQQDLAEVNRMATEITGSRSGKLALITLQEDNPTRRVWQQIQGDLPHKIDFLERARQRLLELLSSTRRRKASHRTLFKDLADQYDAGLVVYRDMTQTEFEDSAAALKGWRKALEGVRQGIGLATTRLAEELQSLEGGS